MMQKLHFWRFLPIWRVIGSHWVRLEILPVGQSSFSCKHLTSYTLSSIHIWEGFWGTWVFIYVINNKTCWSVLLFELKHNLLMQKLSHRFYVCLSLLAMWVWQKMSWCRMFTSQWISWYLYLRNIGRMYVRCMWSPQWDHLRGCIKLYCII